jgi:hypothetical protein
VEKRVFERLAHPAKRHYTFARRRLHGTWKAGGQHGLSIA